MRDGAAKQSRRQTGHQAVWAWDGSAGTGTGSLPVAGAGSQAVLGHLGPPRQSSSQSYGEEEREQEKEEEEKKHKTEEVEVGVKGAAAGGRAGEAGLDRPPLSQDKWTGELRPTQNSIPGRAGEKPANGNHNQILFFGKNVVSG